MKLLTTVLLGFIALGVFGANEIEWEDLQLIWIAVFLMAIAFLVLGYICGLAAGIEEQKKREKILRDKLVAYDSTN